MSAEPGANVQIETTPSVREAVNRLLLAAIRARASDIHVEPNKVRFRIDGVLQPHVLDDVVSLDAVRARFKVMGNCNSAQTQTPQDARIILDVNNQKIDLRLSTVPVFDGERMILRILRQDVVQLEAFTLEKVVQSPRLRQKIIEMIHRPAGIVICSGPAGSGKTTLMYSMLMHLDRDHLNVMSIEDPVEFDLPGVSQLQINMASGLTYARAMKLLLRQDPDVLMLGEIRDLETAQIAGMMAMIGRRLFTQMHANSAVATISRLLDLGVEPFVLNSALSGVLAQRLVRRLCPECRKPTGIAVGELPSEMQEVLADVEARFHAPVGCNACANTGFRGRVALQEVLMVGLELREAISRRAAMPELLAIAKREGLRTLIQNGALQAAEGLTTLEEVVSVAQPLG